MVVVAGDDGLEMPMRVVMKEKDYNDGLGEMDRHTTEYRQVNVELENTEPHRLLAIIIDDHCDYLAYVYDEPKDLVMRLRFTLYSTVRQLKYVIATRLKDNPGLDSFSLYICPSASTEQTELVGDDKTFKEFDFKECTRHNIRIYVKRIRKEDQTEHLRVCKNNLFLELDVVNDITHEISNRKLIFFVSETNTVRQLFDNLGAEISNSPYKKVKILIQPSGRIITIDDCYKTLTAVGFNFSECGYATIRIQPDSTPAKPDWINCGEKTTMVSTSSYIKPWPRSGFVYLGLINQAMTCYLNSLLQALYMTPEFRNALYNWEYVDGSEKDAANSIPYQLQKLFLNLQVSNKDAVETRALTKSFGWDSAEAWQQHDIQELCRVMFDALEQKFKNTKQADLINRLYEGRMIDYVKCLECGTEKSREDTFLDIPLPVKPFGSAVAYNSVEEALRAFVQPETLDGVNQYFCETCNKKCDAHKGLKFKKFPYILTLHLKRFDFDFNTFHRIKLNDKVTFPDILNVNSLIPSSTDDLDSPSTEEDGGIGINCDDSSTTDSGHLDEGTLCDNGITTSQTALTNNGQDDDDGIYISNTPISTNHSQENKRNRSNRDDSGVYQYDLFSIMIHSGSASGGHYYAYIKDFRTQKWLCFDDQRVDSITLDDIQKTYGGGPTRAFYSGAYSTSTNAYMLMYRQIDHDRNCLPMSVDDFPEHIRILSEQIKDDEEQKIYALRRVGILVWYHDPVQRMLCIDRLSSVREEHFWATRDKAHCLFCTNSIDDDPSLYRIVMYDPTHDVIECSFEGREDEMLWTVISSVRTSESARLERIHMLLQTKKPDEEFVTYRFGEVSTTVFVADIGAKKIVDGPFTVRVPWTTTVAEYKKIVSKSIHFYPQRMCLGGGGRLKDGKKIEMSDTQLREEGFYNGCKLFIETRLDMDIMKPFRDITPRAMWDLYDNIVMMHVYMPDTSEEIIKEFNIPAWKGGKNEPETDKLSNIAKSSNSDTKIERNDQELTSQSNKDDEQNGETEEWQEQSNSEDSSLSDSDRTLVGDASEDDDFAGLANVDQELYSQSVNDCEDIDESLAEDFFRVGERYGDPVERIKIYVHRQMKRSTLKKKLEPILKVPVKYFKITRQIVENNEISNIDIRDPTEPFSNSESLTIKLCRAIRDGDFRMRLYFFGLRPMAAMDREYICDFIVFMNSTVAQIKRELVVYLKENHNIHIPYERLRLRKKRSEVPGPVLFDDMTLDTFLNNDKNLKDHSSGKFFIQELENGEIITNPDQIVLFVWRYYPASRKYDDELHEILLETRSIAEVKTKLSEASGIPVDRVSFCKGRFPVDSGYESQQRREYVKQWQQFSEEEWTTCCGFVNTIFYRDISEDDATNAVDDSSSRAINHRRVRRTRFDDSSILRRERALKIFVDDK